MVTVMVIKGIQKLSLLDYPAHVGCTIFTSGCNFRCPFCHNASVVYGSAETIPTEDIFDFLQKRKGVLDAVTVSGGEPLMQKDIMDFLRRVKDMGFLVKLDTNGSEPELLKKVIDSKAVDYVAMDLKNRIEKYNLSTGVNVDVNAVIESAQLLNSGIVDGEFRTTVVKQFHQKGDIAALTEFFRPHRYFLQGFVDSGGLIGTGLSAYGKDEMSAFLAEALPFCGSAELRGI